MTTVELIDIVERLGGPSLTSEDIDWVTDLPVGKDVVEFLLSLQENEVTLNDIALEKEELEM